MAPMLMAPSRTWQMILKKEVHHLLLMDIQMVQGTKTNHQMRPHLRACAGMVRVANNLGLLQCSRGPPLKVVCGDCRLNQPCGTQMATEVLHRIRVQWVIGTKVGGSLTKVGLVKMQCGRQKDVLEVMRTEVACLRL